MSSSVDSRKGIASRRCGRALAALGRRRPPCRWWWRDG